MMDSSEEPPEDTSGRGTPMMGNKPITAAMLMMAWANIQPIIAATVKVGKLDSLRCMMRTRVTHITAKRASTRKVPKMPNSSPKMAKM